MGSIPGRADIFPFAATSNTAVGYIRPVIQRVPGTSSLELKRPGREADDLFYLVSR